MSGLEFLMVLVAIVLASVVLAVALGKEPTREVVVCRRLLGIGSLVAACVVVLVAEHSAPGLVATVLKGGYVPVDYVNSHVGVLFMQRFVVFSGIVLPALIGTLVLANAKK